MVSECTSEDCPIFDREEDPSKLSSQLFQFLFGENSLIISSNPFLAMILEIPVRYRGFDTFLRFGVIFEI
jgi:hypothetical protein